MPLFGSLFGSNSPEREKVPYLKQYKKYNKLDIKKVAKRFDKYDKKKFLETMNKEPLKTGQTIYAKNILQKMYDDHGFRFKRKVKETLTDKPDNHQEEIKARNLAHARLSRLREEDHQQDHFHIGLPSHEHNQVKSDLTHFDAHVSVADLSSSHGHSDVSDHHSAPHPTNVIPLNNNNNLSNLNKAA